MSPARLMGVAPRTLNGVLVAARDGTDAVTLTEAERGWYTPDGFDADAIDLTARRRATDAPTSIRVIVGRPGPGSPQAFGLPTSRAHWLPEIAECAVGEYLDGMLEPPPPPRTDHPASVDVFCSVPFFERLRTRESADDEAVTGYVAAKTYWAWVLNQRWAEFALPDQLRLRRSIDDVHRIATIDVGDTWSFPADAQLPGWFALKLTQRGQQKARRGFQGLVAPGVYFDVQSKLQGVRYRAVAAAFKKAVGFLVGSQPDYENAAKEGVTALESLARIVAGGSGWGEAISALRRRGALDALVANAWEKIWAYANAQPGVRHGHPEAPELEEAEARHVLNLCSAAIVYLLDIDRSSRQPGG